MYDLFCMDDIKDEIIKCEEAIALLKSKDIDISDWICRIAPALIIIIRVIIIFVGKREKEILRELIQALKEQCDL